MVYLGFGPEAAGWEAQTIPQSYGGCPILIFFVRLHWFGFNQTSKSVDNFN